MDRLLTIMLSTALLAGCSVVPQSGGGSAPAPRSEAAPMAAAVQRSNAASANAASPSSNQCFSQLGQAGVQFTPLPDRYTDKGCALVGTVQMSALQTDRASAAVSNLGPVTCPVSTAFAGWARFGVDRAAQQILGASVRSIETMGSFACRNVAGTGRRSAHATGAAIDIAGFVLEDGRRITVASHWDSGSRAEREFLRTVQNSACKRFGTVLGPEYNAAHHDHFHLEGVIEGSSFCR